MWYEINTNIWYWFFFQFTTIDDSIDNDPNYVEPALDIEGEEEYDGDDNDDDDDVGGSS